MTLQASVSSYSGFLWCRSPALWPLWSVGVFLNLRYADKLPQEKLYWVILPLSMVENIPLWKVLPPNSIRVVTKPLIHGPMGTFKIQPKATSYIFLLCWETKEILNVKQTNCRSKRKNLVKNLLPQISMLMVKINRKKTTCYCITFIWNI